MEPAHSFVLALMSHQFHYVRCHHRMNEPSVSWLRQAQSVGLLCELHLLLLCTFR